MVIGGWFHGKCAGCGALGLCKRPARFERRQVAERGVQPYSVVVVAPKGDLSACVIQGVEDFLVQQLAAQAAVQAFDECARHGLWTSGVLWLRSQEFLQHDVVEPGICEQMLQFAVLVC